MNRFTRRQVVMGMLPCLAAVLGACGAPLIGNSAGRLPATSTSAASPGAIAASPSASATLPAIATAARAATPAAVRFVDPQGTPARALPPMPWRTVAYDPVTSLGDVPAYFFAPASLPDDPQNAEVMRALWRYYEVRFAGEATLQTDHFPEIMTGQALASARAMIEALRAGGSGQRHLSVGAVLRAPGAERPLASLDEVKPLLIERTDDRAELYVTLGATIVRVDPITGARVGRIPDRSTEEEGYFTMRRLDGDWKMVDTSFGPLSERP